MLVMHLASHCYISRGGAVFYVYCPFSLLKSFSIFNDYVFWFAGHCFLSLPLFLPSHFPSSFQWPGLLPLPGSEGTPLPHGVVALPGILPAAQRGAVVCLGLHLKASPGGLAGCLGPFLAVGALGAARFGTLVNELWQEHEAVVGKAHPLRLALALEVFVGSCFHWEEPQDPHHMAPLRSPHNHHQLGEWEEASLPSFAHD